MLIHSHSQAANAVNWALRCRAPCRSAASWLWKTRSTLLQVPSVLQLPAGSVLSFALSAAQERGLLLVRHFWVRKKQQERLKNLKHIRQQKMSSTGSIHSQSWSGMTQRADRLNKNSLVFPHLCAPGTAVRGCAHHQSSCITQPSTAQAASSTELTAQLLPCHWTEAAQQAPLILPLWAASDLPSPTSPWGCELKGVSVFGWIRFGRASLLCTGTSPSLCPAQGAITSSLQIQGPLHWHCRPSWSSKTKHSADRSDCSLNAYCSLQEYTRDKLVNMLYAFLTDPYYMYSLLIFTIYIYMYIYICHLQFFSHVNLVKFVSSRVGAEHICFVSYRRNEKISLPPVKTLLPLNFCQFWLCA